MDKEEGTSEFESGYSDDKPAEKPEVVAEVPEGKVAEPEPEVKPDPMQDFLSRFEQLEKRTRNTEGHIGGLNHNLKLMQETMAAANAAKKAVSDAPTQSQVNEAITNPKEWDELKGDFPEWARATEMLLDSRMPKGGVDEEALTRKLEEKILPVAKAKSDESAMEALYVTFPDWEDEVKTPEFKAWREKQSQEVQALGASSRPRDAAKMLRLFEKSRQQTPVPEPKKDVSTRQKRIEAAVTPKGSGGFTQNRTDIDEFEAGYSGR